MCPLRGLAGMPCVRVIPERLNVTGTVQRRQYASST